MSHKSKEKPSWPSIHDLGLIGDRQTTAILTKRGEIVWYCPERFDNPSLFASLLDPDKGGAWSFLPESAVYQKRAYKGSSAILKTYFGSNESQMVLTDFMPVQHKVKGICRMLTSVFEDVSFVLEPAPLYGQEEPLIQLKKDHAIINQKFKLYSSHAISAEGSTLKIKVKEGEEAWLLLSTEKYSSLSLMDLLHLSGQ